MSLSIAIMAAAYHGTCGAQKKKSRAANFSPCVGSRAVHTDATKQEDAMTQALIDMPSVLDKHTKWLCGEEGFRANLFGADLSCANLIAANLPFANLSGADLRDTNLRGANLFDADLRGANLSGADLSGACLSGADLIHTDLIDSGRRNDGYRFIGWIKNDVLHIIAGCRNFPITEARNHWLATRSGTPLGDETTAILDHIERVAIIRGLIKGDAT
jgi:hypothetical protein